MAAPAARLSDMHTCPMVTGVVPHAGGPVSAPGSPNVLIGELPAARVTDMLTCSGPPDMIAKGSASVFINGLPAARMGDQTAHGGVIVSGCPTVLIGDEGGGAGGGGGGGGGGSGGRAVAGSGSPSGGGTSTAGEDFADLFSSGHAVTKPLAQARALVQAAKYGKPFCARCHGL